MQTRFNRLEIFILVDEKSKISIDLFPAFSSAAEEILIGFGANLFIVSHIDANPLARIKPKSRNLLDNASNLLTNLLTGGSLGSIHMREKKSYDIFRGLRI